ncbi:MAG: hypothetical protein ACE5JN_04775 [Candidatus Methylomirabilia bacterium]
MFGGRLRTVTVVGMLLFVVVGCGEGENPVQQYAGKLISAPGQAGRAQAQVNMQLLRTAIQQYRIERGRFPASLTDLPVVQNQRIDPTLYVYDSTTGDVRLR